MIENDTVLMNSPFMPRKLLVVQKTSDLLMPELPSAKEPCSSCGEDCWVSESVLRGVAELQGVSVMCTDCLREMVDRMEAKGVGLHMLKIPDPHQQIGDTFNPENN